MKRLLFSFLIMTLGVSAVFAQKKLTDKGFVKFVMKVTDGEVDNEAAAMVDGMSYSLFIDDGEYRVTMDMMGGVMKIDVFLGIKDRGNVMLMDVMGERIKVELSDEDLMKISDDEAEAGQVQEIEYDRTKRKTIQGYDCYYAEGISEGIRMKMYLTDKIQFEVPEFGTNTLNQVNFNGMDGYPLEITFSPDGLTEIVMEAVEISKKLPKGAFEVNDEGYKTMDTEEFLEEAATENEEGTRM